MTSRPHASTKTKETQLRDRVVSACSTFIKIAAASAVSNTHPAITAYNKARDRLRADIIRAVNLFAGTDALLSCLLDDLPAGLLLERHCTLPSPGRRSARRDRVRP